MSYASLLVHVDADGRLGSRSSIAADLADRFHALLIGLAAWAPMSVFPAEQAVENPAIGDFHLQDMKTLLDQKGKEFCAAFARPDRKVEWRSILDFPTEAIAREAGRRSRHYRQCQGEQESIPCPRSGQRNSQRRPAGVGGPRGRKVALGQENCGGMEGRARGAPCCL